MDSNLIFVFLCFFLIFGAGGTLFWKLKKDKDEKDAQRLWKGHKVVPQHPVVLPGANHIDATMSQWKTGVCKTLSGTCGKGEVIMTRQCINDGSGDGKKCSEFETTMKKDCYVQCQRPKDVIDWGHPNDASGLPVGSPHKGWYDISGQGQPNDYCRWVGAASSGDSFFGQKQEPQSRFWACHIENKPYIKVDPSHISFSGGPANRAVPFHPDLINKMCPENNKYLLEARDPDLQKSIANGFLAHCGARCVYDHRNPKTGWTYDGVKWNRIEDMSLHACGVTHNNEFNKALMRYETIYDVKNAFEPLR